MPFPAEVRDIARSVGVDAAAGLLDLTGRTLVGVGDVLRATAHGLLADGITPVPALSGDTAPLALDLAQARVDREIAAAKARHPAGKAHTR